MDGGREGEREGGREGGMDGWMDGWMNGWMNGWREGGRKGGREGGRDGWMNMDLQFHQNWLIANRQTLNVLKTEFMLVGSRQRLATLTQELDLSINGISLKRR